MLSIIVKTILITPKILLNSARRRLIIAIRYELMEERRSFKYSNSLRSLLISWIKSAEIDSSNELIF